MGLSLQFGM
jgi:hypothetical protein